jgi:hypothetical protein
METQVLQGTCGNVSIGAESASISFKIARANLGLQTADELFAGHRVSGRIEAGGEQANLPQFESASIEGSFDAKGFNVRADVIRVTLSAPKADVALDAMSELAQKEAKLYITGVAELPDGDGKDEPPLED